MKCDKLFETIDDLYGKYLGVWQDVCNLESPTENKAGVDDVGKYFADMARERGWNVEVLPQKHAGDVVCITMNADNSQRPVALAAHIDTVHAVGTFGNPAVKLDEKNIYGPGVMDCKGGAVAAFLAMDALAECGFLDRPVMLLLDTDEECNSRLSGKETINYICEKAKDAAFLLNCESSRAGTLVLERKGILRYRFDIKGKGIHSSRCGEGASAIREAAHKILALEEFKDQDGLTCNCGTITGGSSENTVPDSCSFTVDIRFSTCGQMERIMSFVEETAKKVNIPGCSCTIEQIGFRPAMEKVERNMLLLEKMNGIFEQNGLPKLPARKSLGGSDAAEVTTAGIPCVDSIGVEGDFIHTPREYAVLESLGSAAKRIASVIFCM